MERNEDLRVVVYRFRGLAATHLLRANISPSSQNGEVLSLTLLNNSNIDYNTFMNATSALLALAKALEKEQKESSLAEIPKACLTKLNEATYRLSALEQDREVLRDHEHRCVPLPREKFMEKFRPKCV